MKEGTVDYDLQEKLVDVTSELARDEQRKMDKIRDMRDRAVVVIKDIKSRYTEDEVRRDPGVSCQKLFAEFIVMYTEDKL